jgi:hypothetical protein
MNKKKNDEIAKIDEIPRVLNVLMEGEVANLVE